MARPYSMDLGGRAVARVQAGERGRLVARTLSISAPDDGERCGRENGGHQRRLVVGAHAAFLRQRIAQGDFTLRSLVAELAGRGLKVDYRTVWSFAHREGLSFKKNRFGKRTRPG
jgi:putative transposase